MRLMTDKRKRPKRWWKSGPKRKDKIEVFNSRIYPEPNTGCWLYLGCYSKEGYGRLDAEYYNGFRSSHRFSYFIHNGDFDRSLCVMHTCDNPTCVNPDHLRLGTNDDNMADMVSKGRATRGTRNVKAKLNESDVIKIRELNASGVSRKDIRGMFPVGKTQIAYVIKGINWKHV